VSKRCVLEQKLLLTAYRLAGGARDPENAGLEKAGVENAGVGYRGGKCRSDNEWKAIRKEKKSRAYRIPTT